MKKRKKVINNIKITRTAIPNLLTLGNAFSGFAAIVFIAQGNFRFALFYIFMAAIFDLFDGIVARILHATSELGAELDSLCDTISFGVAPSFLLYKAYFEQFGDIGIVISSIPTLAGVYRLARFNSQLNSFNDKLYFKGLPIPAGALTILSYIYFYVNTNFFSTATTKTLTIIVTILVGVCMVSKIKFDNFPRPTIKNFKANSIMFLGVIIAIVVGVITTGKSIFPTMLVYIFYSILKSIIIFIKNYK
ncbi:MAG: CDP-diacylglycerol--serine O-phosphatidyltransferase [Bacteroidetes bacterium]|nr:CDP-diacylglycerol--serine O-phosphatidyltransferase [Bacteroidota bacterium]